MNRSFSLGSILGIAIKVHWTFFLLVTWIFLASLLSGSDMSAATSQAAFVLLLFGCVVLHELGHALAARCFGIQTEDITLLPIGGLARLERMPRHPFQEIVVALAGPAVNVVIATLLLILIGLPSGGSSAFMGKLLGTGTLEQLVFVNIALVAFNMLPAFPLDGGRVLRALLAIFLDYSVATRSAARLGQVFAVGLGLLGLANPFPADHRPIHLLRSLRGGQPGNAAGAIRCTAGTRRNDSHLPRGSADGIDRGTRATSIEWNTARLPGCQ